MELNRKCIQYFFDSKKYNPTEVVKTIEKERIEQFPKEKAKIEIKLNEFGVYEATLIFEKRKKMFKSSLLKNNNIKENQKIKNKKTSRYEKLITQNSNREYGKYRETKTYRPY